MIGPSIITLASDFIQHIFLIVLVGLALVEHIISVSALKNLRLKAIAGQANGAGIVAAARYMKATRIILIIAVMAAIWFIGEYFFNNYSLSYRLFLRWPLVLGILFAFIVFMRRNRTRIPYKFFLIFAALLSVFIVLDIVDYFISASAITILLALERIAAMIFFFFSFLAYFASNRA